MSVFQFGGGGDGDRPPPPTPFVFQRPPPGYEEPEEAGPYKLTPGDRRRRRIGPDEEQRPRPRQPPLPPPSPFRAAPVPPELAMTYMDMETWSLRLTNKLRMINSNSLLDPTMAYLMITELLRGKACSFLGFIVAWKQPSKKIHVFFRSQPTYSVTPLDITPKFLEEEITSRIDCQGVRYVFGAVELKDYAQKYGHECILIVDTQTKQMSIVDPNGPHWDDTITELLAVVRYEFYTRIFPDYGNKELEQRECPVFELQRLADYTDKENEGLCWLYSYFIVYEGVRNDNLFEIRPGLTTREASELFLAFAKSFIDYRDSAVTNSRRLSANEKQRLLQSFEKNYVVRRDRDFENRKARDLWNEFLRYKTFARGP